MRALLLWLALTGPALAAPCALDVPADHPFEVAPPTEAKHVQLLVELWVRPGHEAWLDAMLKQAESRGLALTVMVPYPDDPDDPALAALAARAAAGGHEVGVVFQDKQVPLDALAAPGPLKRRFKGIRKAAGGSATAATPLPSRTSEAIFGTLGFKILLQTRGPATAIPRPAVVFEGQPRAGVVLQGGPYAGPCGIRPMASPLTPAAADRTTQALWGAARVEGVPTVRLGLRGSDQPGDDPAVLGRWIDEVLTPAGIRPTTPSAARTAVQAYFRSGKTMSTDPLDAGGGRLVSVEEVKAAAAALDQENILPRELPGELNLSEAFLAFTLLLADQTEGEVVRLGRLAGPNTHASGSFEGIVELDREAVVGLAKALAGELPDEVPAALPVDGRTLTAAELLTAFASAVRGDPVQVWPTASPDPNAVGQGWGAATLP